MCRKMINSYKRYPRYMKKTLLTLSTLLLIVFTAYCQSAQKDTRLSPQQLREDLAYLKQQLFNVHAYPYTEISPTRYNQLFADIASRLTDSSTATAFLKEIKPLLAYLCDEHAQAYLPNHLLWTSYQHDPVFMPVSLVRRGKYYQVDKILYEGGSLKPGDIITKVDNIKLDRLIEQCALFTSGYPEQRTEKALQQFGYLYTWTLPAPQHYFVFRTRDGKETSLPGVPLKVWQDELGKQTGWDTHCDEKITYQKIGNAGYITACSFNFPQAYLDTVQQQIDSIFRIVKADHPAYLFIDVSKNSGGQSIVGNMLIDYFYTQPYRDYSFDFRRSDAYINLLKSWGIEAPEWYKTAPEGKLLHFDSDTIHPQEKPYHYNGKVFIIVGKGTFSSAMMFATLVKDNNMAVIAGETPMLGHPNKFGELYNTRLPNTKIELLFGVKRWIRPKGIVKENLLKPDILINLTDDKAALIQQVLGK